MTAQPDVAIGDVLFLKCTLCDPIKDKYFVVMQLDPLRMFLVNSECSAYVDRNPNTKALMIPLLLSEHGFFHHDSFLACNHLSHEYTLEKVQRAIELDSTVARGRVHPRVYPAILGALRKNHLVARKYLRDLVPIWTQAVEATSDSEADHSETGAASTNDE